MQNRKTNRGKKSRSGHGEQDSLPPGSTAPAQAADLSDECVVSQEIQTSSSEVAKQSADLIASDSGGARENGSAVGLLGREAEGLEVVSGGGHCSASVMNPLESSTGSGAATAPGSAALKEMGGGGSTAQRRAWSGVEERSAASDAGQALETKRDSQSLGGKKKPASVGERTDVSSGISPDIEVPKSKAATSKAERPSQDTKTSLVAQSSKAGKGKQESSQKVSSSPSSVSV